MKKIITILLITCIIFSIPFYSNASDEYFKVGDEDVYEGVSGYQGILRNISYKDATKNWAKSSIYKLSALGIMNGANGKFNPKAYISKRQVLECVGRALGIQSSDYVEVFSSTEVISKEEFERIDTLPDNIEKKIEDYVKNQTEKKQLSNEQAEKLKMNERDKYTWGKNATREEVAAWIGRTLRLTGTTPYTVNSFKDNNKFNEETKYIIESVLQGGYMSGFQNGYFKPKHFITREEFAKTLDNALDELLQSRGFKIKWGEIKEIKILSTTEEKIPVVNNIYYMENEDRTYPIIYTSKSSKLSLTKGFIIYNGTKLTTSDTLDKFVNFKYYVDDSGKVVYGELKPLS